MEWGGGGGEYAVQAILSEQDLGSLEGFFVLLVLYQYISLGPTNACLTPLHTSRFLSGNSRYFDADNLSGMKIATHVQIFAVAAMAAAHD